MAADTKAWTIGQLLTWTTDYLKRHGAESPRLDAEVLLAHARGCPRIELYTAFDEPAEESLRKRFRALVRRRSQGEPVAYLVGEKEFFSLPIHVTPDVLIPRPETEHLVTALLDLARATEQARPGQLGPLRILDVGTGSGCVAIAAARHLPTAQVTAIDIDPAALQVAERNARRHNVAERIAFLQSDLLASLDASQHEPFDFIVSNPPYIADGEAASMSREVSDHEPVHALFAGPEGTEVFAGIVSQAACWTRPLGWLLCEISATRPDRFVSVAERSGYWRNIELLRDLSGLPRVLRAQRAG